MGNESRQGEIAVQHAKEVARYRDQVSGSAATGDFRHRPVAEVAGTRFLIQNYGRQERQTPRRPGPDQVTRGDTALLMLI